MYPVSEKFLEQIDSNSRNYYWTGTITTKSSACFSCAVSNLSFLNTACEKLMPSALEAFLRVILVTTLLGRSPLETRRFT